MTQPQSHSDIAKHVCDVQIEGLTALKEWAGDAFDKAVDIVSSCKGKVMVSGMGKSGHIGRKIAATLASTGTPSLFVHPAEASHGDLGMIGHDDVVILLSNSGETHELKDVITYCKRFSIPMIGIVRREASVLAESATVPLILPEVPEACVVNAPTTSTTMMLVIGDALAVALLEGRGFTKDDFGLFHPGGKLGAAFIKVADVMHTKAELPLVTGTTPMSDVLIEMSAKGFGCVGVLGDDQSLSGIITDGDLRRHMGESIITQTAGYIMTASPETIAPQALASEALAVMQERSITSLFVTEKGLPKGIIHIHDLLRSGVA